MKKTMTLVLALIFAVSMVAAQEPIVVGSPLDGSAAVVPGAGTPPLVEYLWVLPDEDPVLEGTQVDVQQASQRDDIYACLVVSDVENRDTIIDVFTDVYHPDGSFKYQIHAEKIPLDNGDEILRCANAALDAGLIDLDEFNDITYKIFDQQIAYMWKVWLPMYYHQPAGDYEVRGFAIDSTSLLSAPLSEFFTWVPGTFLAIDFNEVAFGSIQPGAWKILNGDLDFTTSDAPTLRNEGNVEVNVSLMFSEFVGQGDLPNKVIDDFDAQLRNLGTANNHDNTPGEHLEFVAEEQVSFTYPIELCRQEKLDLSIHADVGTLPDDYAGTLTIYADGVPTDDWGELDGDGEHNEYGPFPRCGTHMDDDATCPLPLDSST